MVSLFCPYIVITLYSRSRCALSADTVTAIDSGTSGKAATAAFIPHCVHHVQVLLNVLADEIHRAHQRCMMEGELCEPENRKMELVFEAGINTMKLLKGAYSCISMIAGVGLVAFRDPFGIRSGWALDLTLT